MTDDAADICGAALTDDDGVCSRPAGAGRPVDSGPCWQHVGRTQRASDTARLLPRLFSAVLSRTASRRAIRFARQAGAPREGGTDRSGFLSYHAETHSLGIGLAAGFYYGATGDKQLMAAIVGIALAAERGQTALDPKIVEDIRSEPHYALAGVVPGYMLGFFASVGYFPDQFPIPGSNELVRWLIVNGHLLLG
jgi:hypothetical protein